MRSKARRREKHKLKDIILNNIYTNIKSYIVVITILLIGIVAGVIFINNIGEERKRRNNTIYK